MSRIGLAFLILSLWATPIAAQEAREVLEISARRTPGAPLACFHPGEPAEEIVLFRLAGEPRLIVRVNVPRAAIVQYTEKEVRVTEEDFEDLAKLVREKHLLDWEPEGERRATDWGEVGFRIRVEAGKDNERTWKGQLRNEEAPRALFRRLAKLARDRADVPIVFLAQ